MWATRRVAQVPPKGAEPVLEMVLFLTEQAQPLVFPLAKVMDNFDGTSKAVFTWWDGDGTKVYIRSSANETPMPSIGACSLSPFLGGALGHAHLTIPYFFFLLTSLPLTYARSGSPMTSIGAWRGCVKLTYPDGSVLNYEYNSLNRLTKITDEKTKETYQFIYDSLGRRTKLILPNGVSANYEYDSQGQIISLRYTDKEGKLLKSYRYLYDKNGNRIQIDSTDGESLFGYDKLNQLIRAKLPKLNLEYFYDAVGNRISLKENDKLTTYELNELNQIKRANQNQYEYDKNGNLTKKITPQDTTEYLYDYDNRLIKIIHPDKSITEYKYDSLGRRIQKITNQLSTKQLTNYIYSGWQVIAETDEKGNITKRYIYGVGIDEPLSLVTNNQFPVTRYYLQDALNNVVGLTDSQGKLVEEYHYTPFGVTFTLNRLPFTESKVGNNYLFAGREYDPESGLYYFRYRYYDPGLGRFISAEPQPHVFLVNLYDYVFNNPIRFLDPLGLTGGGGYGGRSYYSGGWGPSYTYFSSAVYWSTYTYNMIKNATQVSLGIYAAVTMPFPLNVIGGTAALIILLYQ